MSVSLWLIPHTDGPFDKEVQELIQDTIPSNFSTKLKEKHIFIPHVTLTSEIDPAKTYEASGKSPQEWLDALSLPEFRKEHDEVVLELDHVEAGDAFFKRLFIDINKDENVVKLAAACRREAVSSPSSNGTNGANGDGAEDAAQRWAKNEYMPHMSLLYADIPKDEIKKKVPLIESQIGYGLGGLFACCGGSLCLGGQMVLVPTNKPIGEWKPIAQRATPWVNWRMGRNLS